MKNPMEATTMRILSFLLIFSMLIPGALALVPPISYAEDIGQGQTVVLGDTAVHVERVETGERCRVNIGGRSEWLDVNEREEFGDVTVEITEANNDNCVVYVTPGLIINELVNERPHVWVTLEPTNVEANQGGYHFIQEGQEIRFRANIVNTGNHEIEDVLWVLYNNGYPTGDGATKKEYDTIDLKPGDNIVDVRMQFYHKEDTLYNTGSFITAFLVDPSREKTSGAYAGHSLYVGHPTQDIPLPDLPIISDAYCGDGYCQLGETAYSCHNDCGTEYRSDNIYATLVEGQTGEYTINGKTFKITAKNIEDTTPASVMFEINGAMFERLMYEGDEMQLKHDVTLMVEGIFLNLAGEDYGAEDFLDSVSFYLKCDKCLVEQPEHPQILEPYEVMPQIPEYQYEHEYYDCKKSFEACFDKTNDERICEEQYEMCVEGRPHEQGIAQKHCNDGCFVNSDLQRCVPVGTRLHVEDAPHYCDMNGVLQQQRNDGETADNNYECKSNSARYGVCENVAEQQGFIKKIFTWLSGIFG